MDKELSLVTALFYLFIGDESWPLERWYSEGLAMLWCQSVLYKNEQTFVRTDNCWSETRFSGYPRASSMNRGVLNLSNFFLNLSKF